MFDPTLIQPWTAAQAQAVTEEWTRCVRPDAPMYFVLDDDPTGGQTVHDVPVFTAWMKRRPRSIPDRQPSGLSDDELQKPVGTADDSPV